MAMGWRNGLLETMKDAQFIVIKTEQLVAIKDKFPKARHHFLVMPLDNIDDAFSLTKKDIPLVKEMNLLALNVIELVGQKLENFKIGFHAEPSMIR
jgi:aprataxin